MGNRIYSNAFEISDSSTGDVDKSYKDAVLNELADRANVAQFASFSPGVEPRLRFLRLRDGHQVRTDAGIRETLEHLLRRAPEGTVNIRSFLPGVTKGHEFIYGISNLDEVVNNVERLAQSGLFTIVNETVNINDGGVSGVMQGGLIEFAPEDTPRCVERPGTAAFSSELGIDLLTNVYGFSPDLNFETARVEFSLHPLRRGIRNEHTIIWEISDLNAPASFSRELFWPNRFSEFVGDKAFGLLVADLVGLDVPRTRVIARKVAPFVFGLPTGSRETWIRPCPKHQVPGKYSTQRGWRDPFELFAKEDPDGTALSSVLAQDGVEAHWSGALITDADDQPIIEGVAGIGDEFMLGLRKPESVPLDIRRDILRTYDRAKNRLGPVRMEWAHDGERVWVLQMHVGRTAGVGLTIVEGDATKWNSFDVKQGLEALRTFIETRLRGDEGVILSGDVGITSHFADLLRRSKIPSRIEVQ